MKLEQNSNKLNINHIPFSYGQSIAQREILENFLTFLLTQQLDSFSMLVLIGDYKKLTKKTLWNNWFMFPLIDQTWHHSRQRMGKWGYVSPSWISHWCKYLRGRRVAQRRRRNSLCVSCGPWNGTNERLLGIWVQRNWSLLFGKMEVEYLSGKWTPCFMNSIWL